MADYIFIRGSHTLRVILLYYYRHHHHHIIHTSFHSVFHSHIVDAQYESRMRDRKKPNENSLATTLTNEYFHFFFSLSLCIQVLSACHIESTSQHFIFHNSFAYYRHFNEAKKMENQKNETIRSPFYGQTEIKQIKYTIKTELLF